MERRRLQHRLPEQRAAEPSRQARSTSERWGAQGYEDLRGNIARHNVENSTQGLAEPPPATSELPELQPWDPLAAALAARKEVDFRASVARTGRRKPHLAVLLWWHARMLLDGYWPEIPLWILTVGTTLAGLVLLTTWPWTTKGATSGQLVAAAATATAFSGVLLSILATSLRSAIDLSPGYSVVILRWWLPWATATLQVLVAGFLFILSTTGPSHRVALAAGLLAAGQFGAVWIVGRRVLQYSDPALLADRYVAYVRADRKRRSRWISATLRPSLQRQLHAPSTLDRLTAPGNEKLVVSRIRSLGDGAMTSIGHRHGGPARTLIDGACRLFADFSDERAGRVGGFDGPVQALLDTGEAVIRAADHQELRTLAADTLTLISDLATRSAESPDYAIVRTLIRSWVTNRVDEAWLSDSSWVPSFGVAALGNLSRHFLDVRAVDDGLTAMDALVRYATRAGADDKKVHVALKATHAFVSLVPTIAAQDATTRSTCFARWVKGAQTLTMQTVLEEPTVPFWKPFACLLPGVSVHGPGLAQLLWETSNSVESSRGVVDALLQWLAVALPLLGQEDNTEDLHLVRAGLSMLHNTALFAADRAAADPELGRTISRMAVGWVEASPHLLTGAAFLLHPDLAELLWGITLAAAYTSQDRTIATESATWILAALNRASSPAAYEGVYSRSFVDRLLTLVDADEERRAALLSDHGCDQHWDEAGTLTGKLQHGPGMDFKYHDAVAPKGLIERISAWVVQQWPGLDGRPGE